MYNCCFVTRIWKPSLHTSLPTAPRTRGATPHPSPLVFSECHKEKRRACRNPAFIAMRNCPNEAPFYWLFMPWMRLASGRTWNGLQKTGNTWTCKETWSIQHKEQPKNLSEHLTYIVHDTCLRGHDAQALLIVHHVNNICLTHVRVIIRQPRWQHFQARMKTNSS